MSEERKHWLVREDTIRKLWIALAAILALTVVANLFISIPGHFWADGLFAFFAVYGFGTCVVMIVFAKVIGIFLKRPDDYYDRH